MNTPMKLSILVLSSVFALSACNDETSKQSASAEQAASAASAFGSAAQQASYAMGMDIGTSLKQMKDQGTEIDLQLFNEALQTVMDGKEPRLSAQEAHDVMMKFLAEQQEKAQAKMESEGKANLEKGKAFLAENAKKEGVKTTASGLQYKVNKEGSGKQPKATDVVAVEYVGKLIDGTEFDSSNGKNVAFPLNQVIAGWTEGLQLMKEGAEYTFYIPAELAYGDRQAGEIPANSTLIFDVKLLSVQAAQ